MQKYPLFISTISGRINPFGSVGAQVTDQQIIGLQKSIAGSLSSHWSDVAWEREVPQHWIEIDLVPVSCDGPPDGVKPLSELNVVMRDLQERLLAGGETLDGRVIALIGQNDDAMAAYAAFASLLQRSLSSSQIVMVIGVQWNGESWDVAEVIPQPYEFSWQSSTAYAQQSGDAGLRQNKFYVGNVSVELTGLAAVRQRRTINVEQPRSASDIEALAIDTEGDHTWSYQGIQVETVEVTILSQPLE